VPSASPFLDTLLTRWIDHRHTLEDETESRLDGLKFARQALDDALAQGRRRRHAEVATLREEADWHAVRWAERLRRVGQWSQALAIGEQAYQRFDDILAQIHWFDKTEQLAERFNRRLFRAAERLEQQQLEFSGAVDRWLKTLATQQQFVERFKEKERQQPTPLLVSRTRKRIDTDFVRDQQRIEADLNAMLQPLRRRLTHMLSRLYRANRILEQRSSVSRALFELRKNNLLELLNPPQRRWFALRDGILQGALVFESGRKTLLDLQRAAESLHCVEDAYKEPESWWTRFWKN
jgi:hypothetical protein